MIELFEVGRVSKKRKKREKSESKAKKRADVIGTLKFPPVIGKVDDVFVCGDPECESACFDVLEETDDEEWLVECAFCGMGMWVKEIPGYLDDDPDDEAFRFRDGRFQGMTLAAASRDPRGIEYIKWAASTHKRPAVREACKNFLDTSGPSS